MKEFDRAKGLLAKIGKDDALYEQIINTCGFHTADSRTSVVNNIQTDKAPLISEMESGGAFLFSVAVERLFHCHSNISGILYDIIDEQLFLL